jgi:hypothetical protein
VGSGPKVSSGVARAVLAACLLTGCASEVSLRAPDVDLRSARVVFMPSMVAIYRIEGCDLPFDDRRSKAGRTKVDGWLRFQAAGTHGRFAELREIAGSGVSEGQFYEAMNNLTRAMFADWGMRPIGDWTMGPFLANWATTLHADYLVFVIVRGSVLAPTGQAYCQGGFVEPLRRAGLVVVQLQSGRIVRFQATKLEDVETEQIAEAMGKLAGALDFAGAPAK